MTDILNITNGDSAVKIMQQARIKGDFLPWRDVLHDGPVPENLSLDALSQVRAEFICQRHWGDENSIKQSFVDRDNKLKSFCHYQKVILWFEHDLYDQLQVLQILDWFHGHLTSNVQLSMICTEHYLGMQSAQEMIALTQFETAISQHQLNLASQAWAAFRAPNPKAWFDLLEANTSALPFLHGAVLRMIEEYPNHLNGLSRIAETALKLIAQQSDHGIAIFRRYQKTESRVFLGDLSFWEILKPMIHVKTPLISVSKGTQLTVPIDTDQILSVTETGEKVLNNELNWLDIAPLNQWVGGVHLNYKNIWLWNSKQQTFVKKH